MAGSTVVPLPSSGNTNTWSPNITQLGTGANQLTINGSTGIISAPTINATSLQEGGVDIDTLFMKRPWSQGVVAIGDLFFLVHRLVSKHQQYQEHQAKQQEHGTSAFQHTLMAWLIHIMFKFEPTRE